MSIITSHTNFDLYPSESLHEELTTIILSLKLKIRPIKLKRLLGFLECFLQVTGKKLDSASLESTDFNSVSNLFIGALNSKHFCEASSIVRYDHTRYWLRILKSLKLTYKNMIVPPLRILSGGHSAQISGLVESFDQINLNTLKVEYWRGWLAENIRGRKICIPLQPLMKKFGREFTVKIFSACQVYLLGRHTQRIVAMKELCEFLADLDTKNYDFNCPVSMSKFWHDFLVYYLEQLESKNIPFSNARSTWTNFTYFVENFFNQAGIFVPPFNGLPKLHTRYHQIDATNIRVTDQGITVHAKLLTDVPINMTDAEAINEICERIKVDFDIVIRWATWSTDDLWGKYQNIQDISNSVEPLKLTKVGGRNSGKTQKKSRENELHLNYVAATFKYYGYLTSKDAFLTTIYPVPLSQTARELALPDLPQLIAFAILLIADSPCITQSFIESLELFDNNGKLTGFVNIDHTSVLTGYKPRKQFVHAQQIISLTERSTILVERLILITNPLRKYLKERGDDNWRKLFLNCNAGFGYPRKITTASGSSSEIRSMDRYVSEIQAVCNVTNERAREITRRLSLTTVRASAGTLIYLKNKSVFEMATALGHESYDSKMIGRYLPVSISNYFRVRTIRVFQMALVAEALADSHLLKEALGFENDADLSNFLTIHALNIGLDTAHEFPKSNKNDSEVIIEINEDIMFDVLITSESGRAEIDIKDRIFAQALIKSIEEKSNHRPDLLSMLNSARHRRKIFA